MKKSQHPRCSSSTRVGRFHKSSWHSFIQGVSMLLEGSSVKWRNGEIVSAKETAAAALPQQRTKTERLSGSSPPPPGPLPFIRATVAAAKCARRFFLFFRVTAKSCHVPFPARQRNSRGKIVLGPLMMPAANERGEPKFRFRGSCHTMDPYAIRCHVQQLPAVPALH